VTAKIKRGGVILTKQTRAIYALAERFVVRLAH
jgi:hypothetical protein